MNLKKLNEELEKVLNEDNQSLQNFVAGLRIMMITNFKKKGNRIWLKLLSISKIKHSNVTFGPRGGDNVKLIF